MSPQRYRLSLTLCYLKGRVHRVFQLGVGNTARLPITSLNQAANAAVKTKGSIFEIVYRRMVRRLGHAQTIRALAHQQCLLIWLILRQAVRLEERGLVVTKQSKQKRTARMIRRLRSLGYRIEPPNPQPSQAQAQ